MKKKLIDLLLEKLQENLKRARASYDDVQNSVKAMNGSVESGDTAFREKTQSEATRLGGKVIKLEKELKILLEAKNSYSREDDMNMYTVHEYNHQKVVLCPVMAGEKITYNGEVLVVVSPASPAGKSLLEKRLV